jgi:hypothetical protein
MSYMHRSLVKSRELGAKCWLHVAAPFILSFDIVI